jgi:hypothetical protein
MGIEYILVPTIGIICLISGMVLIAYGMNKEDK